MPHPLTFHLAACLYPGGVFERSAFPSHLVGLSVAANAPGPSDRALRRLHAVRQALGFQTQVILTGDQIYVDATAGLFDPTLSDAPLEHAYDRMRLLPWRNHALEEAEPVALMDDHEVGDNWEPSLHPRRQAALSETLRMGRDHFIDRQLRRSVGTGPADTRLWRPATLGERLLFVGDTRSERTARDPAQLGRARIMSDAQRDALHQALSDRQKAAPTEHKFVATSSVLLPRRLSTAERHDDPAAALRSDAWDGYPTSLHGLLAHICHEGIERCVFLSGDEHIGCVAEATVQQLSAAGLPVGRAVSLWSVHAGALYAPFPFANSVPEDFPTQDLFDFDGGDGRRYRCTVNAWFAPARDGFAEVRVLPDGTAGAGFEVSFRDGLEPERDTRWPPVP